MKTIILSLLIGSISQAGFNEALCKKKADKANSEPTSKTGEFKLKVSCFQKRYNVEVETKRVDEWNKLSSMERDSMYQTAMDQSFSTICRANNPVWLFTDEVVVYFSNGKDKLGAFFHINKSECGVKEQETVSL